ncbi:MAG: homoserine kinase [Saprospiraceae bacterium]
MSQYTRLNHSEIADILAAYGLSNLSTFKILSGGSENTNYYVETATGKYVLSICEQKSVQQATDLAQLLEYLAEAGFQTSKVIRSLQGEAILVRFEKPIILKEYLEGEIQQDLSPTLLKIIGKDLARLHQIEAPVYLPKGLGYGIEKFHQVDRYAPKTEFADWLKKISTYIQPYLEQELPKTIIHSDLFWSNIIIEPEGPSISIMDFEEAAYYYRVFDLGMTIIGICAEGQTINLEKARHFLSGYQTELSLSANEKRALKAFTVYAGAAMTFWRHQNFNETKPDPAMFDHYLGLKVLVDFMMVQDEDCFF